VKNETQKTVYCVKYTNSRKESKTSTFQDREAAELYYWEKFDSGYRPMLYSETTSVKTKLIRL